MNSKSANIIVTPLKSALLQGHRNKLHVMIRMQAPDLNPENNKPRPPYGIAFVIDRSGSMAGKPLQEAIRCVDLMVDRLRDEDMAALVTFEDEVDLAVPLTALTHKQHFKQVLREIDAGGSTNLFGGWQAGAEEIHRKQLNTPIQRVIVLSDGCANQGLTNPREIAKHVADFAHTGITTSTYGLGRHFNEELMIEIANAGRGSHYYAEQANDLMESFHEEFDLMGYLWTNQAQLSITPAQGVSVRLMNDYRRVNGENHSWHLPNIAYGSEAWAMLEITCDSELTENQTLSLFIAQLSGQDIDGKAINLNAQAPQLPVVNPQAYAAIADDELVRRRLDELQASDYLIMARNAARHGDWQAVENLIKEAKQNFANNPWVQDVLTSMEKLATQRDPEFFSKEALFSHARFSKRLSSKDEAVNRDKEYEEMSFLRRKRAQGKGEFV